MCECKKCLGTKRYYISIQVHAYIYFWTILILLEFKMAEWNYDQLNDEDDEENEETGGAFQV